MRKSSSRWFKFVFKHFKRKKKRSSFGWVPEPIERRGFSIARPVKDLGEIDLRGEEDLREKEAEDRWDRREGSSGEGMVGSAERREDMLQQLLAVREADAIEMGNQKP